MNDTTPLSGKDIIGLIYRSRKGLLLFFAATVTCAIVFSMPYFITPLYKSEVILYPPSTNSNKLLIDYDMRFGADKEIDEHLQVLRSGILRDSIIHKYALMNRYEIDTDDKYKFDKLYKKYEDRITTERTVYNAISVLVYDADPDTAALIANDIVLLADKVKEQILKRNFKFAYETLERKFKWFKTTLDSFAASLKLVKDLPNELDTRIGRQLLVQEAKVQQDLPLLALLNNYEVKLEEYKALELKYYEARQKLDDRFPASYVITPAKASAKKAYPVRWLIVSAAGLCSLLAGAAFLVIREWIKRLKAGYHA